jgi:thiol-disulfide isomerase/thioredoxin
MILFRLSITTCYAQTIKENKSFILIGKLIGRDTGLIVLWYPDTSGSWIRDTSLLDNGTFSFEGRIKEPSFVHLIGSNKEGNYGDFYLHGGKQRIQLEENKFVNIYMEGSFSQWESATLYKKLQPIGNKVKKLTSQYESLQNEHELKNNAAKKRALQNQISQLERDISKYKAEELNIRKQFILTHPNSYVSPTELLGIIPRLSLKESDSFFNSFNESIKGTRTAQLCRAEIEKKKQMLEKQKDITVGAVVNNFQTNNFKGQTISLKDFKGCYILLDFWASWCVPCRKAMPELKKSHAKYQSHNFDIIAISTDQNKEEWLKAIEKDSLNQWVNVLQTSEMKDVFAGVTMLPTQLLLDREGKIIWSSLETNKDSWEIILEKRLQL